MEEKIGNVILDETWYSGEDRYSDGPEEDQLLEIARNCREEDLNRIIADRRSWAVLYHFSHIRQNIISWLPVTKEDRVLEIGSGCGAVTGALARMAGEVTCVELSKKRSLINASRNRDYSNIRILVGNFQDIEPHLPKYDYITLIGVLEYAGAYLDSGNPPVDLLRMISKHLTPGGRLVIAIENRLGMKYFAGCAEDHTGAYFEGIEGYPGGGDVRTYTRGELSAVLQEAGQWKTHFYYPCPDYKFPMVLYSDERLPKKGDFKGNVPNLDRPRMVLFDETKALDSLSGSGLFPEFANSFLVLAQKPGGDQREKRAIYFRYSNERADAFKVRTDILEEGGERLVRKVPLDPRGEKHLKNLLKWQEILNEEYASIPFLCNRCYEEEGEIRLEYVSGGTLEEILDALLVKGEKEKVTAILMQYLTLIRDIHEKQDFVMTEEFCHVFGDVPLPPGQKCLPVTNIDLVCSNLIPEKVPLVLDYEWTFDFPVPCKFVLYRIVHYYIRSSGLRSCLDEEDFFVPLGITKAERQAFALMEENFQEYITRGHHAIRDLCGAISPGILKIRQERVPNLQIFFNTGAGYRLEESVSIPLVNQEVEAEIPLPPGCAFVRVDPGDDPCALEVVDLSFREKKVDLEQAVIPEGTVRGNWVFIAREDPCLAEIPVPVEGGPLLVSLVVHPWDEKTGRQVLEGLSAAEKVRETQPEERSIDSAAEEISETGSIRNQLTRAREWIRDPQGGPARQALHTVLAKGLSVARRFGPETPTPGSYWEYATKQEPSPAELARQRQEVFSPAPLFSLVTPLYNTPIRFLVAFIESVRAQSYTNWELCLADGSPGDGLANFICARYAVDSRIRYLHLKKNRGIAGNTNAAIRMARGDFVVFADHDDLLAADAFYQMAVLFRDHPETELAYSDEDLVDEQGRGMVPHFKPDYNPDLLCSINYICHLTVVRRELQRKVGYLRRDLDGSQDYDFLLRCTEVTQQIRHLPRVLYHWRVHGDSTAGNSENKNYAIQAGLKALQSHYNRMGIAARATYTGVTVVYRTAYQIQGNPLVSVLILPAGEEKVQRCLDSLSRCGWENLEVRVLNRGKVSGMRELEGERMKVFSFPKEWDLSRMINYAAGEVQGEYLLFLHGDTEGISDDWMERLLGYCQREGTGAAGAKILDREGRVVHAGRVAGMSGSMGYVLAGTDGDDPGYLRRLITAMDVSAVSGACMMVKHSLFDRLGGVTEGSLWDADLCLRIGEAGEKVVFVPEALVCHDKALTLPDPESPEVKQLKERHREIFTKGDPCYNPNQTLTRTDCSWGE